MGRRFQSSGVFNRYKFSEARISQGAFLPVSIREHKLCASAHTIQRGDAPQLQRWRGRTVAITVYGKKSSEIFCAVLGSVLYLGT